MEVAAVAVAIASIVGLIIVPLIAWQGEQAWPVSLGLFVLAILCASFVAWRTRPTELQTAIEVDRQWKLSDLLSSAMGLLAQPDREGLDQRMCKTVFDLAVHQLSQNRVDRLIFSRVSPRLWASLSSLPVLLILLTAICSHPLVLKAAAQARGNGFALSSEETTSSNESREQVSRESRQNVMSDDETISSENRNFSETKAASNQITANNTQANSTGSSSGKTNDARIGQPADRVPTPPITSNNGTAAGGSGYTASRFYGDWRAGIVTAAATKIAPWEQSTWEDRRTRALQSLDQNPPAAAYRDLIRDYFSR